LSFEFIAKKSNLSKGFLISLLWQTEQLDRNGFHCKENQYIFSISGLQYLLNNRGDYAAEHEISFNSNKTICVFLPKKYEQPAPSNVFLNGIHVQFLTKLNTLVCG